MRDRHCEIQYKGPVYSKTLWNVQEWTDQIQASANQLTVPLHISIAMKDRVVSPQRAQALFKNASSQDKVLNEYEVGHEILANKDLKDSVLQGQIDWLEQYIQQKWTQLIPHRYLT